MNTEYQNDTVSEAMDRVREEIVKENARPTPNPYIAVFVHALLSPLPVLAMLYGLFQLYVSIDTLPLAGAGRAADLTLGLARESLMSFITGLLTIGAALLWWMVDAKRRMLEELCGNENRQQPSYSPDDLRPKAPDALRAAIQELRTHWPATEPQPRLVLTFLKEPGWIGTPPHVRWSILFPDPERAPILPPARHQRTYTLSQF